MQYIKFYLISYRNKLPMVMAPQMNYLQYIYSKYYLFFKLGTE